jgi:hypothetical protein
MLKPKKNISFYFSLYFERSPPAEDPKRIMHWERSCYISMFPWKDVFDGMDEENSKSQGGKGQIRKIQKK